MGKRKYKRVALVIGLLFFTMLFCGIQFGRLEAALETEKEFRMGQLITKYPELEQDIIEVFENSDPNKDKMLILAGKKLEEKYGYTKKYDQYRGLDVKNKSIAAKHRTGILLFLFGVTLVIGMILVSDEQKQFKLKVVENRTREELEELKSRNQVLLERLMKEEIETKALVTDISHQLKTPLSSLKMSYEIALSDDFTETEREAFLNQGKEEIRKLESLLEALLNLARLEKNMIEIKPESISIKKTLIAAVNSVYIKAFEKQIDIILEDFVEVKVLHDSRWTQEAFVNVLDNAIKYSEPKTSIKLKVTEMVTYILVEITDEGIGVAPNEYLNIFKRFYRGQSEKVQGLEGSGVGLYLARKILEEQGGSICVKAGIRAGSVFQITLPKAMQ